MLIGTIITLDPRRCVGEVEVEHLGWRIPADIPPGLSVGDRVQFLIQSRDLNLFDRQQRAVELRRA